jgi:16S rRNA (guanine527-N7)-methyltransferase
MDIKQVLKKYLESLNIQYEEKDINKIIGFLDFLHAKNKEFNLVGTKDMEGLFIRHFLDSISLLEYKEAFLSKNLRILDMGTGAGLPGLLLAIVLKEHFFLLIDKSEKKISFLKEAKERLEVKNCEVLKANAETIAHHKDYREAFDIVIARAVAKINILLELIIPFCKINGKIILYKSRNAFELEIA